MSLESIARTIAKARHGTDAMWANYMGAAREARRAVIEDLRDNPTKEMIVAGSDAHDGCIDHGYDSDADGNRYDYTTISPDAPAVVFRAMLTQALQ